MQSLLHRLASTGSTDSSTDESEEPSRSTQESKWAIESILEEDIEWDDSFYAIIDVDQLEQLQDLEVHSNARHSRSIKTLKRYPDTFSATLLVRVDEDGSVSTELDSIFYDSEELKNEPIGYVARWIGYSGPHVHFDIEGDSPKIVIYGD